MSDTRRSIRLGFSEETFSEGLHVIYVYNDDRERKRTMARFLQQGLLDGEKLLYLVDDISPDEMRQELGDLGVDLAARPDCLDLSEGHFSLCPNRCFSRDFMLGMVGSFYDSALEQGYVGARGAGEMSWALVEGRATVPELLAYEAELNDILDVHPLTTVCQYDARRFAGDLIWDMLSVHPLMIVRGQLVKNPCYVPPGEFLAEYQQRQGATAIRQ